MGCKYCFDFSLDAISLRIPWTVIPYGILVYYGKVEVVSHSGNNYYLIPNLNGRFLAIIGIIIVMCLTPNVSIPLRRYQH